MLEGKTAIVTGGSAGIGAAITIALVRSSGREAGFFLRQQLLLFLVWLRPAAGGKGGYSCARCVGVLVARAC